MKKIQYPPFNNEDPIFVVNNYDYSETAVYYSTEDGHFLKIKTRKFTAKSGLRETETWYELNDAEWEEINIKQCGRLKWL